MFKLVLSLLLFGQGLSQVCQLIVPAAPLTGTGLMTPYILQNVPGDTTNNCNQLGPNSAFVEAVILNVNTGNVAVYRPLVINNGTTPAVAPKAVTVDPNADVVGIWFGFNGQQLTLVSEAGTTSVADGNCVSTGFTQSFGTFAYCNAANFYAGVNNANLAGLFNPPGPGISAVDGVTCPTSRDIFAIDQNPSSGVATQYLVINGAIAQDNSINRVNANNTVVLNNGLANDVNFLANYLLPSLGCSPYTVIDLTDGAALTASVALQEIQADLFQPAAQALVSRNSPMAQVNGKNNVNQLNQLNGYRVGVNQPIVQETDAAQGSMICMALGSTAVPRLVANTAAFAKLHSPNTQVNMFNFMLSRINNTFNAMNCAGLGVTNPTVGIAAVPNNFHTNPPTQAIVPTTKPVVQGAGTNNMLNMMTIGIASGAGIVAVGAVTGIVYYTRKSAKSTNAMAMEQFL